MVKNKAFRLKIVRESHYWFFHYYFASYITYQTANFQKEILSLTEDDNIQNLVITAFRGSGKSTLVTLSYVIWSMLGKQQKKFPLIIGHTQEMAQNHFQNIKYQFENNIRLKKDLGPFQTVGGPWGAQMLVLTDYKAKITTASVGQSIRGTKYNQNRPDLLVLDDIETIDSTKTQEGRDSMYQWFTQDVLPSGDLDTKMIFIGTPLHYDSVLMRMKKVIEEGKIGGKFLRYPFFDENGISLWKEKFKSEEEIQKEKNKVISEIAWQHEYMLNLATEDYQIIKPEWMQKYDNIPERKASNDYRFSVVSVDPGVKQKEHSCPTAVVFADVFGSKEKMRIYIQPRIVNRKMEFGDIINFIKNESEKCDDASIPVKIVVEDVAAQNYIIQQLNDIGIKAIEYHPVTGDKRERLIGTTKFIQDGIVLFPHNGVEILNTQILGFGNEKYDVMDAFTMLVHSVKDFDRSYQPVMVPRTEYIPPAQREIKNPDDEADRILINRQLLECGVDMEALKNKQREKARREARKKDPATILEEKHAYDQFRKMMAPLLPHGMR